MFFRYLLFITLILNSKYSFSQEDTLTDQVFTIVETMPQYPGGEVEMMNFIKSNLKPPKKKDYRLGPKTGITKFVVYAEGKVVEVHILKSSEIESFDLQLVNMFESMPRWTPATQAGKTVRVEFTMPIKTCLL